MKVLITFLLISSLSFISDEPTLQNSNVIHFHNGEVAPAGCWVRTSRGTFYWYDKLTCQDFILGPNEQCWDCCPKEIPVIGPMNLSAEPVKFELREDGNGGTIVWDLTKQEKIATLTDSGKSKITTVRTIITTSFKKQEKDGKTYIVNSNGEKIQLSEKGKKKIKKSEKVEAIELEKKKKN